MFVSCEANEGEEAVVLSSRSEKLTERAEEMGVEPSL